MIAGDGPADTRAMLGQYLKQIKQEADLAEGAYQVKDPYHGEMALLWKGRYIWGTLKVTNPGLRSAYLQQFESIVMP